MKNDHEIGKMIALITQIGITMLTSIFLCGAIGYYIDNRFNKNFLIFFIILGVAGGYRGIYTLVKTYIKNGNKSQDERITNILDASKSQDEDKK